MRVLGLTGGIACGKSNVSETLRELGAVIIDGDVLSRELTAPGGEALPAIRARFGVPPTRYYQALNALVDRPDAWALDPLVVGRMRRVRAARHPRRSPEVLGRRSYTV